MIIVAGSYALATTTVPVARIIGGETFLQMQ